MGFIWKMMQWALSPVTCSRLAFIFSDLSSVFLCICEVIVKRKTKLFTQGLKSPLVLFSACRLVHFFKMTFFLFLIFPSVFLLCYFWNLCFLNFIFLENVCFLHPKVSPFASPPTHALPWISVSHCMLLTYEDSYFIWSTFEVLKTEWQVRVPLIFFFFKFR